MAEARLAVAGSTGFSRVLPSTTTTLVSDDVVVPIWLVTATLWPFERGSVATSEAWWK